MDHSLKYKTVRIADPGHARMLPQRSTSRMSILAATPVM